jgi:hypothetical protein
MSWRIQHMLNSTRVESGADRPVAMPALLSRPWRITSPRRVRSRLPRRALIFVDLVALLGFIGQLTDEAVGDG